MFLFSFSFRSLRSTLKPTKNARLAKNQYQNAIADYNKAVELFPDSFEALFNRGAAKQITGDYAGAIADLTKVLQLQPENADVYLSRAMAFEEKNAGAAIADYTKTIELDPTQAQAFARRGLIFLGQKKKPKRGAIWKKRSGSTAR